MKKKSITNLALLKQISAWLAVQSDNCNDSRLKLRLTQYLNTFFAITLSIICAIRPSSNSWIGNIGFIIFFFALGLTISLSVKGVGWLRRVLLLLSYPFMLILTVFFGGLFAWSVGDSFNNATHYLPMLFASNVFGTWLLFLLVKKILALPIDKKNLMTALLLTFLSMLALVIFGIFTTVIFDEKPLIDSFASSLFPLFFTLIFPGTWWLGFSYSISLEQNGGLS